MIATPTAELVTAALADLDALCRGIAADLHALGDLLAAREA